ncbi:MAG: WbqC family protein [Magnetococcales bacterium]|nr:WbqC family protein [Magnetococcales bacterium]MBF0260978.1 WbqC family protein [Magnetococcales bacterium]
MQPYFFPYIGYFQLIRAVDRFIVYDTIKYTKKGWINRNRILQHGAPVWFSLPLMAGSDDLAIDARRLASDFRPESLLNRLHGNYRRAPCFEPVYTLAEGILRHPDPNLFAFLDHGLRRVCDYLGIQTAWVVSSSVPIDHDLKAQEKVIALCRAVGTDLYVNPIGGQSLYERAAFAGQGIELRFLQSELVEYRQFDAPFVPWLSILDVMMFNSVAQIQERFLPSHALI